MRRNRFFASLRMTAGVIAGLVALGSCSVKEDRSDAACWITVTAEETTSISAWYGSQRILDSHLGGLVDHMVPRGIVDLVASDGDFTAPEGQQMNELYAQLIKLDTDGEFAYAGIELKKQFANVFLDFKEEDNGRTEYDLQVTGTVSGADIHTLKPVEGRFLCVPEEFPDRGYRFRAPRQKDESMALLLQKDGETIDTIPLGELIRKAGFDWTQESLGDVSIICDLPAHTFTITVMEWGGTVTFNITI